LPIYFRLLNRLKNTILHPQWLSNRFHTQSKKVLKGLRNNRILDIGSGNTAYKSLIHFSNYYIELDYPSTNKNYLSCPQIYGDARSLPFKDNDIDTIFLFEVLEHINETEAVLNEIARVLTPEGQLFLSVPFIYPIHDAPNDFRRFTRYGLNESINRSGLNVQQIKPHGNTLVAAFQMFNMGLLEGCRDVFLRSTFLGLVCGAFVYPVTLIVNLFALPFIYLPLGQSGCLGYFLKAQKSSDK